MFYWCYLPPFLGQPRLLEAFRVAVCVVEHKFSLPLVLTLSDIPGPYSVVRTTYDRSWVHLRGVSAWVLRLDPRLSSSMVCRLGYRSIPTSNQVGSTLPVWLAAPGVVLWGNVT